MPKAKKAPCPAVKTVVVDAGISDQSEDEAVDNYAGEDAANSKTATKRSYVSDADPADDGDDVEAVNNSDLGGEMSKFVETLGFDMNKALQAKRKRLEQYTADAIKANRMKIKEMWQSQAESRKSNTEELHKSVSSVLTQWEQDLSHFKEQEDKMLKIIHQQVKLTKEVRLIQSEKLENLRRIHENFLKEYHEQEMRHSEQCSNMQIELKKELLNLQKKMMKKTQQEELANMQMSLKSMLFM